MLLLLIIVLIVVALAAGWLKCSFGTSGYTGRGEASDGSSDNPVVVMSDEESAAFE